MSKQIPLDDIAALAKGGRTNFFGFFLRLAARIPFLFIAGRADAYGAAALGRFASALVVIELTAMLCTMGEKRGLAQRLSESDERPANVVADGTLLALIASCTLTAVFWLFPGPLFPGGKYTEIDRLMVLAIPPLALTEIWLAALAYRYNIAATVRARAVVEPLRRSEGMRRRLPRFDLCGGADRACAVHQGLWPAARLAAGPCTDRAANPSQSAAGRSRCDRMGHAAN